MKQLLILCLLLFHGILLENANADLFLLEKPVVRTTRIPLGASLASAALLAPAFIDSSVYYMASEDPILASALFAYCAFNKIPEVVLASRVGNELYEEGLNRAMLNKVSCGEGTKSVKVLKTRYAEHAGIASSKIHSSSFILVETEGDKLPVAVEGMEWLRIEDPETTIFRLKMNFPGSDISASAIDLKLADLLDDSSEIKKSQILAWRKALRNWNKERSFFDRRITGSSLPHLTITNSLVLQDGTEAILGEITHGNGVAKFLGQGFFQRLISLFADRRAPKIVKLNSHRVVSEGDCQRFYTKIFRRK